MGRNATCYRSRIFCLILPLLCLPLGTTSLASNYSDTPPQDLPEADLWREYYGWREAGDVDKAHEVALQLLQRTANEHGKDSGEFGRALAEVGVTEVLLERHDAALTHLERAEDLLKEHLPLYSENLIAPLAFLGSALQASGDHREAMRALSRAQHVTHRLWGVNTEQQIPIAYAKADSALAMGDVTQAMELQHNIYKLHRVNYGESSPQTIDASAYYGNWLRVIGDYHGSIAHFHQSLKAVQGDGPDIPEAYPLLKGMAHAYQGGFRGRYARSMYKRLVAMMAAHPAQFRLEDRMRAYLDYGNWAMQRYHAREAVAQYEAAWQLASESGPAGKPWLELLAEPAMVRYGEMAPQDHAGNNQYVTFNFELTDDGRPRRIKVIDHGTDSGDKYEARRNFPREIRYRPAIVDGKAIATAELTATMFVLPPDIMLEPEPIAAPDRLTDQSPRLISLKLWDSGDD